MSDLKIPGGIPKDARIDRAIEKIEQNRKAKDARSAKAVLPPDGKGLEVYGITLRRHTLAFEAMLARFSYLGDFSNLDRSFAWIYMLAAPLDEVYETLRKSERFVESLPPKPSEAELSEAKIKGAACFMSAVHAWLDTSGIPSNATGEVIARLNQTFELAQEMARQQNEQVSADGVVAKKN
jgi:hypothetical protein